MRILAISESPLHFSAGRYFGVDSWIRFLSHLSQSTPLTLWAPVRVLASGESLPPEAWEVDTSAMTVVHNDPYATYAQYARLWWSRSGAWKRTLCQLLGDHDIVLLRLPSPSLRLVMTVAERMRKPVALLVAGDMETQSDRVLAATGLKRSLYRLIVRALARQEVRWGRRAVRVFAYSRDLARRHEGSAVLPMRTPHLALRDFASRADTCQRDQIHLLRVAWLLPSKGLEFLLEAVKLLAERGLPIRLSLVGEERAIGYRQRLESLAANLGIGDRVTFQGWVPFDRIAEHYLHSDIQVISSLAEGTPRCIAEGLARGLPLVCTRVGGCGDYLTDGHDALLVPPADARAIADAVEKLIHDGALRRSLIQNGYQTARAATFDGNGRQFLQSLELALEEWRRAS